MLNYSTFDSSSLLYAAHAIISFAKWDNSDAKSERQVIEERHAARKTARMKANGASDASSLSELKEQGSSPLA